MAHGTEQGKQDSRTGAADRGLKRAGTSIRNTPSPVEPAWSSANAVPVAVPLPDLVKARPPAPAVDDSTVPLSPQPKTTTPAPEPVIPAGVDTISSAFIIATDLRKHAGDDDCMPELASVGLLLAAIALLGACWSEAILRTAGGTLANWMVAGALFSAVLLYLVSVRMAWPLARGLALTAQIAGAAAVGIVCAPGWSLTAMLEASGEQPLLGVFMVAGAAFATSRMLQGADVGQSGSGKTGSPAASALLLWAGICGSVRSSILRQAGWSTTCLQGWAVRMRAGSSCMPPRSRSPQLQACGSAHAWRGHNCAGSREPAGACWSWSRQAR